VVAVVAVGVLVHRLLLFPEQRQMNLPDGFAMVYLWKSRFDAITSLFINLAFFQSKLGLTS